MIKLVDAMRNRDTGLSGKHWGGSVPQKRKRVAPGTGAPVGEGKGLAKTPPTKLAKERARKAAKRKQSAAAQALQLLKNADQTPEDRRPQKKTPNMSS